MDELLHAHWQQLKSFTERLEDITNRYSGMHAGPMEKLMELLADMQRATDAAKDEYEAF